MQGRDRRCAAQLASVRGRGQSGGPAGAGKRRREPGGSRLQRALLPGPRRGQVGRKGTRTHFPVVASSYSSSSSSVFFFLLLLGGLHLGGLLGASSRAAFILYAAFPLRLSASCRIFVTAACRRSLGKKSSEGMGALRGHPPVTIGPQTSREEVAA